MRSIKALLGYLDNIEEFLAVTFLATMCVFIGLQIIFRYILNWPLAWTEELARYLFVWVIYLGASMAVRRKRHLKVDIVLLLLGEKGKFVLRLVSNMLFLFFCVVMAYEGAYLVYSLQFIRPQYSPAVRFPMSLAYLSVLVGVVLMGIALIRDTVSLVKERNLTANCKK